MNLLFSSVRRAQWCRPAAWLLVLLALLLHLPGRAQTVPPRPDPPRLVNDLAGLLQPQEVAALEQKLVAYNDSTSSQIAVVTVPDLGGNDIFDYAQKLYETWGIGQKGRNNGILLLIAKQERTARIHTGRGLEGAVPDALAKRIISNTIAPAFEQNQYYAGIDRATDQLIALARDEYKADPQQTRSQDDSGSGWLFWVVIAVLVLFVLFRPRGGGRGGRGGFGSPIIFGDFSGGRGVFGGGGGWGGGFGGGFGGFGGGNSGGGGASGSW
ncbi:MAG: TPM domain-containing protein [Janthinobacterium lividum]